MIAPILTALHSLQPPPSPTLIAIEGFGGAGKTTLAAQLHAALPRSLVIHMDDFIIKSELDTSWQAAFDRDRLAAQVLLPASATRRVRYQPLLWHEDRLGDPIAHTGFDVLIVEGLTAYFPDIEHHYHLKVWVDTPLSIAAARGHARDGANENADRWDTWAALDQAYLETFKPSQRADLIIPNP